MELFTGGILINVLEIFIRFIASLLARVAQFIAGIIFNQMDAFLGIDQNIVTTILKPIYNFSIDYLKPIGLELLVLIVVWNLFMLMFGKFSAVQDDPAVLLARAIFFGIIIIISPQFINLVGNTIVLNTSKLIAQVNANDLLGTSASATKKLQKVINNSYDSVNTFLGQDDLLNEGDLEEFGDDDLDNNPYTTTTPDASDVAIGSILIVLGGQMAFALFVVALVLYALIYGFMVLWIAVRCLKICWRLVCRLAIFFTLLYLCPLPLACGAAKSTQRVFSEWIRMIAGYGLSVFLTSGFMKVAQAVIYTGFIVAGNSSGNLINIAFSFGIVLAFLKIIIEIEKYIDKLGLNAIGLPDRPLSMMGHFISMSASRLLSSKLSSNAHGGGKMGETPNMIPVGSENISDDTIRNAFEQGMQNGEAANNVMTAGVNGDSFTEDSTGTYGRGTDGLMHELDENGNAVDGAELESNDTYSMTDNDNNVIRSTTDGVDDVSRYAGVEETKPNTALYEDMNGDCYMSNDGSHNGNVAVRKSDLENDTDKNGNTLDYNKDFQAWQDGDGDKYRRTKDGGFVNIGDGSSYSVGAKDRVYALNKKTGKVDDVTGVYNSNGDFIAPNNQSIYNSHGKFISSDKKSAIEMYGRTATISNNHGVRYTTTGKSSSTNLDMRTNRIVNRAAYNTNIPKTAHISDVRRLEYCDTLDVHADGTKTGIALQHLNDGSTRHVKFTLYDVNEITKDTINKHSLYSKNNPCEGYTPDGKQYIHIEKYLNDKKRI